MTVGMGFTKNVKALHCFPGIEIKFDNAASSCKFPLAILEAGKWQRVMKLENEFMRQEKRSL